MVSQNVITAVLIGIVITGVIPVIGGIALLATKKIKGTSFWAGVLAYVIAMIAYSIVGGIVSVATVVSSGNMTGEVPPAITAVLTIILGVAIALSMCICIGICMKNTRTFNGALSCGLGYAAGYAITSAISFVLVYMNSAQINSGEFDKAFAQYVEAGFYDKETVKAMKEIYTNYTSMDVIGDVLAAVGFGAACVAAAIFIMRSVCAKKIWAGTGISALILVASKLASNLITNAIACGVVVAAIGAAAIIFALRMKKDIVPEQAPAVQDSFMQSIENSKAE